MSIKISDRLRAIEQKINNALTADINVRIRKNKQKVLNRIRLAARSWINQQPEIYSLRQSGIPGSLASAFGIFPGEDDRIVELIINEIINSIELNIKPANQYVKTVIEIIFQKNGINSLINLPGTSVITELGTQLKWLEWLLTKGDSVVITGYYYAPEIGRGRSGGGTMKIGGSFRVPPNFSGTLENNFITRAFSDKEKQIGQILLEILS